MYASNITEAVYRHCQMRYCYILTIRYFCFYCRPRYENAQMCCVWDERKPYRTGALPSFMLMHGLPGTCQSGRVPSV